MGVALVTKCVSYYRNAINFTVKRFTLLTRRSASVLESGHTVRAVELIKEDWPIVLQ